MKTMIPKHQRPEFNSGATGNFQFSIFNSKWPFLLAFCLLPFAFCLGAPLGSAFTYQGRLAENGQPANGSYDLRFTVFDAAQDGSGVSGVLTNAATLVSNGLFTAPLDFGATAFDGNARWLAIEVRTNGGGAFLPLSPRQPLSPAPNAIHATKAGTAASATTADIANAVAAGSVGTAGLAAGAVDSSRIADGAIGITDLNSAVLSNTFWRLGGNRETTPGTHFLGTADNQPLEINVNGKRVARFEFGGNGAPNVVGGAQFNYVTPGIVGATIAGGGATNAFGNPFSNSVAGDFGAIGGGIGNSIEASARYSTIAGGEANRVRGGQHGTIAGGSFNSLETNGYGVIQGGTLNTIQHDANYSKIGGGYNNTIESNADYSSIGGGWRNTAARAGTTIAGGIQNTASGAGATVAGGGDAFGLGNTAAGEWSVVGGGRANRAEGDFAVVAGGEGNLAEGRYAVVPGGSNNLAQGQFSFAAGQNTHAEHDGAFVWADTSFADVLRSTASNQFLVRASGGVGIGTNSPQAALHVAGTVMAGNFVGSGTGLTALNGAALTDSSITAAKFAPGAVNHLDAPDSSPLNAVQVNTNGLVGIGINVPQAGLDIRTSGTILTPRVLFEVQDGMGAYTNLYWASSVSVAGNLCALGAKGYPGSVTLVDISNPQAPVWRSQIFDGLGAFTNLYQVGAVVLASDLLAIPAEFDNAVTLVNVANPANPVKIAELRDGVAGWNSLKGASAVAISGNLLAIAAKEDQAVTLADISNPANPVQRAVISMGTNGITFKPWCRPLALSGNLLAIAGSNAVTLLDVSNPSSPVQRARMVQGTGAFTNVAVPISVALSSNFLAVSEYSDVVTLVEVANPSAPVWKALLRDGVDGATLFRSPHGLALSGNQLAIAADLGVTLFDLSQPTQPRILAAIRHNQGGAHMLLGSVDVAFAGTNLAVASLSAGSLTLLGLVNENAGLLSDGWVGIGTRHPLAPLHVVGDVVIEGADRFNAVATHVELGMGSSSYGLYSVALGHVAEAVGHNSIAIGTDARAAGDFATALGHYSIALGYDATALGGGYATGFKSVSLGDTTASGQYAVSMGQSSTASGNTSTAMGQSSTASGSNSTAMGYYTRATGDHSTALGYGTTSSGKSSLAAGSYASATNDGAFVWADSVAAYFSSTGSNQFLIRAGGGVGINTNNPQGAALNVAGVVRAAAFQGDGAGLTGVSGSSISSGTISDGRLSANVALRSGGNIFSGAQVISSGSLRMSDQEILLRGGADALNGLGWYGGGRLFAGLDVNGPVLYSAANGALGARGATTNVALFWTGAGNVGIGGIPQDARLDVQGNIRLNMNDLFLREVNDRNHGVGWYGATKPFAGVNVDGPVLYGWTGGGVGSMNGGARLALQWDATGSVATDSGSLNAGSLTAGLKFGGLGSGEGIASKRTAGGNQFALDFYTSFSNRMTILNTGDIGIGTLSPVRRLHIMDGSGPTRAGGSIQVGMATTGGDPKLVYFGDGDYVHIGENGEDDTLELKATRFFFTGGNLGIGINDPTNKIAVAGGAYCSGTQWVNASDRDRKEGFQTVNSEEVLKQVAALPLSTWSYKEDPSSRHVGPVAQDFHAAFGFGNDDKAIGTVDADGVALAAIQGLNRKVEAENAALRAELKARDAALQAVQARLEALERKLAP